MNQNQELTRHPRHGGRRAGARPILLMIAATAGWVGCYGDPAQEVGEAEEAAPTVLTQEERVEYEQQVEESKRLLDDGDAAESLPALQRGAELDPNGFAVQNNLCVAHGMLQQRDQAVAACQLAVELNPDSQLAKNNLAWVSSITVTPVAP